MATSTPQAGFGHEVMTMTEDMELKHLTVAANSEGNAPAELAGCVDRLHPVQAARTALARLDAPSLRAALEARKSALRKGSAQ